MNIYPIAWKIPNGIKANCYLFALAPKIGKGGYANRPFKSTPGEKCNKYKNKRIDLKDNKTFIDRILCDNPTNVKLIDKKYINKPTENGSHLMCAMLSPGDENYHQDFHFLRRISWRTFLKNEHKFNNNMNDKTKNQIKILKILKPRWIWAHQRGWSSGGPLIHDAKYNVIIDPYKACFSYKRLNYNIVSGIFLVKSRRATVYDKHDTVVKKNILIQ